MEERSPVLMVVVVLALVAAGVISWVVFGSSDRTSMEDGPLAGDPGATSDLDTAGLEGLGEGARIEEGRDATSVAEAKKAPTHIVAGRVGAEDAGALDGVRVEVWILQDYGWPEEGGPHHVGLSAADGTFEVDVSAVCEREKVPTQLEVRFDHPEYVPERIKLLTESSLQADATLSRAIILTGTVRDARGDPLGDVLTALWVRSGDRFKMTGINEPVATEKTRTKADGTFRLRTGKPGAYYVAALHDEYLPKGQDVRVEAGVLPDAVDIVLTLGEAIRGRVTLNGNPVESARVEASLKPRANEFQFDFFDLVLRDGVLLPGERNVRTDAEGRFAIPGLDAPVRRVHVAWITDVGVWHPLLRATNQEVVPGASDLQIEIAGVEVDVRVVSEGVPVERAQIVISKADGDQVGDRTPEEGPQPVSIGGSGDTLRERTPESGGVAFVLPADETFEIAVEHGRYHHLVRKLRTQGPGSRYEEVLDLGPPKALASLVIVLKDDAGKPITRASYSLEAPETEVSYGFDIEPVMQSEIGEFRLPGLEPGPFVLFVRPGRGSMEFHAHYLTLREEITLAPNKETRVTLEATMGGRIRIAARDAEGNILDCMCTIRDARGQEQRVSYISGGEDFATMSTGGPGSASPSDVEPPLAPGEYEVELSLDGRETRRLTVEVKPGEISDVDVVLRKL